MALSLGILAAVTKSGWSLLPKLCALGGFILLISVTISKIWRNISSRSFRAQHGCKPCRKFPLRDPVLGLDFIITNIRAFQNHRFLELLSSRFRKAGPTWEVRGFHRRSIFTADPENVKTLLSLRFKDFTLGGRQRIMGPLLGQGVFASDGDEWAHSRALLRPNFAKEQVADLSLIETHVSHLFRLLPSDGSTVDLQPLFHRFTLDSATDFLFGKATSTLVNAKELDLAFAKALRYSLDHMAFLLIAGPLRRFWKNDPEFNKSNKICRSYVDTFVDQVLEYKKGESPVVNILAEEGGIRRNSFLRDLANATNDKGKIRGELLSLLLAGRDTTASLLNSLFYHFSRRPDVWAKLREEISTLGDRRPTYAELRALKYAKFCINEGKSFQSLCCNSTANHDPALRLYPPVPTSAKVAVRDTILPRGGGPDGEAPIYIPKGLKVLYSTYSMHRRLDIWGEDADEFRPERWDGAKHSWEYLPFNGGPRVCLGQQHAITETLYIITRFVQEFQSIEARDNLPWTETLGLTVTPGHVRVGLCRPT
ncbi:hypothetical protein N8I77_012901 [Diaporthe amygdali]|uniref:Cytochrome P450 alkane hydroxylase n=1 Tax=Phomopsis amygdali TaxID=1214568 RepID=A0AAD9S1U0_PHOAM|nr:hypothetical protein N8I77_012901 [Diaporthe amygdali]